MPNLVMEEPIRRLLNLTVKQFEEHYIWQAADQVQLWYWRYQKALENINVDRN